MNLRHVWEGCLKDIGHGKSPDTGLSMVGWTRLGKGVHNYAWRSPAFPGGRKYVFKCTGDARPMHSILSEEYLLDFPLLSRHYLRPIFRSHMACIQPYASPCTEDECKWLRKRLQTLYHRRFDTIRRNCGWFRGRLVNFDPHPDY